MRKFITGVAWWLVLTSPVVGWGLYTWITQPHLHPTAGPHRGGVLVEWDVSHETVAEITLDRKSGVVTVYVLDRWGAAAPARQGPVGQPDLGDREAIGP